MGKTIRRPSTKPVGVHVPTKRARRVETRRDRAALKRELAGHR